MATRPDGTRILASIRNALWLIASILLIQTGFHLDGFRKTPFAEIIMLLGFWIGFFLFVITVIRIIESFFSKPDAAHESPDNQGTRKGDGSPKSPE